jgi:hypothetical protein
MILCTLNLSLMTEEAVHPFVEHNILFENRNDYSHHFHDNCTTSIRKIIDLASKRQFKGRFGDARQFHSAPARSPLHMFLAVHGLRA